MYHIFVLHKTNSVNLRQNDWQKISKLLKKKPTCVEVGFLGYFKII